MATIPTLVYNQSFSTSTGTGGPRVNIDYRMNLIRQRESAAPFLALMLNINNEPALTSEFRHFETRPNPRKGTISGAVGGGASTINVSTGHGKRFNIGDVVKAKSATPGAGETAYALITDITADALTVTPNDTSKTLAAMADGDELAVWGVSFAQGTLGANPLMTKPDLVTFYTQIFKHSYQVTATHANNRLYGAPERDRLRGEREIEHLIDIEKALINGEGALDTSNFNDPRTTLSGLIPQITSNVLSTGGSLSKTALFDFMTTVHAPKYAPDGKMSRRMVLTSAEILADINKVAEATRQTMQVESVYGMDISKIVWAGRTWQFVEDPVLSDLLPGWAIVFHPRYVRLREFRPTRLQANIQANDADHYKDQFLTELGLEVQLEELHGVIKP